LNRLLIDLSRNSSRLVGNTYSLLDTTRLIELGEAAEGRDRLEAQMIVNDQDTIEFLVNEAEATFEQALFATVQLPYLQPFR
jgi:Fic family protein